MQMSEGRKEKELDSISRCNANYISKLSLCIVETDTDTELGAFQTKTTKWIS